MTRPTLMAHTFTECSSFCGLGLLFLSLSQLWVLALSAAEPEPRIDLFGEGCLSRASSLAILFGVEAEASVGPRTGENGFGHFCRNKSFSSYGRESPYKIRSGLCPSF